MLRLKAPQPVQLVNCACEPADTATSCSSPAVSYTYDPNGNMVTKTGGWTYSYDYENRLTKAVQSGNVQRATTGHDERAPKPAGHRRRRAELVRDHWQALHRGQPGMFNC